MATKITKIEWTDKTWNPVTGCTKISQGCAHCYAEVMSRRLKAMGLGVTVEAQTSKPRIDCLRVLEAPIRFLSCEPLMEDLGELDLTNIDWVIVGGESGPQARPMKEEWVLNIKRQTEAQEAAFFFKQWGTWGADGVKRNKHKNGKMIGGKVLQAMPV